MRVVDVFVIARDEQSTIATTLLSIAGQQLDAGWMLRVLVVANGCTDNTAQVAREAAAVLGGRPDMSFRVAQRSEAGKNAALNFALDSTEAPLVISVDGDVIFSVDCFARVLKSLEKPKLMVSGAQPEVVISPSLRKTLLGELYRVRQLRRQVVGGRLLPMGRMIAYRRGAFKRYSLEFVGGEDTWMPLEVIRRFGWGAVTVVPEAVVFANPPQNWLDLVRQESRWELNVSRLPEHFTQLQPVAKQLARRMKARRALTTAKRQQVLALMKREKIAPEVLDLDEKLFPQMLHENAQLMSSVLAKSDGTWEAVASTKRTHATWKS